MKILVPIEDPFFAVCVVDFINHHVWPAKTEFLVTHVIEPFYLDEAQQPAFAPLLKISPQSIIDEALSLVRAVSQAINNANPQATVTEDVVESEVVGQIKHVAEKWPADLVIMGSHGRSGFNHFFLGSVALEVASEIQTPLLLIKPDRKTIKASDDLLSTKLTQASFQASLDKLALARKPAKVFVALDETDLSKQIIDFCLKHKWSEQAEFKLFSTIDERPFFLVPKATTEKISEELIEGQKIKLSNYAQLLKEQLAPKSVTTEVEFGAPRKNLIVASTAWDADLLVVGNHVKKSGTSALCGVAMASLCAAPCSVLLIKENIKQNDQLIAQKAAVASAK
ncbi:MAG: universal stress protein [Candidatus Obscuribacterales bacterium]|nr:universal stress protein [Candidatus Obscuribacterales bacterium]